ncbi:MAG: ComEC/Rec2 family competence protein, partial [Mycobacterium sp.]
HASRRVLPAEQAAMLPALVLGDTSTVPRQTTENFRTSGLTHLTAVSGANVTIVCGAVLLTTVLIGSRAAVALAAVTLLGFVVVVQPSPSVLRAAVMGAITLLAVLSHRRRQALPALSASVLVLMVGAPALAVDVGFALSASATAALVIIAPAWSRRLTDRGWPRPLAAAVSVALAAQLVTAPLVAGISGSVSLVAVAANLVVAPVIPPITVIGTAAAALCPLWPAGAELLIRFSGPEVWWLLGVARWAADVPAASVSVPSGIAGVVTVAVAALGTVVVWHWLCSRCHPDVARSCGESRGDRPASDPG